MDLTFETIEADQLEAAAHDILELYEFHIKRFYTEEGDLAFRKFMQLDRIEKRVKKGGHFMRILGRNDELIGYIEFDDKELYLFFILDDHRGKGYGRMTINWLKDYCRKHKITKSLQAKVPPNAYLAYEKLGFEPSSGEVEKEGFVQKRMKLKID